VRPRVQSSETSSVPAVVPLDPFLFSDEVRAGFDLVGFDPRGVIRSTPRAARS
jgi:hypothetical protein